MYPFASVVEAFVLSTALLQSSERYEAALQIYAVKRGKWKGSHIPAAAGRIGSVTTLRSGSAVRSRPGYLK